MPVSATFALLFIIQLFVLTLKIVLTRRKDKVAHGSGGNEDLERKRSAHSNFTAYVPLYLIFLAIAENSGVNLGVLIATSTAFLLARISHSYGIISAEPKKKNYKFRMYGMYITFASMFIVTGCAALAALTK